MRYISTRAVSETVYSQRKWELAQPGQEFLCLQSLCFSNLDFAFNFTTRPKILVLILLRHFTANRFD